MSEWIIIRRPTEDDADDMGYVWVTVESGRVLRQSWQLVKNRPWIPIAKVPVPEPYGRLTNLEIICHGRYYTVASKDEFLAVCIPTREAAERIAAIYEEVMP